MCVLNIAVYLCKGEGRHILVLGVLMGEERFQERRHGRVLGTMTECRTMLHVLAVPCGETRSPREWHGAAGRHGFRPHHKVLGLPPEKAAAEPGPGRGGCWESA